jgi:hypothetical protein
MRAYKTTVPKRYVGWVVNDTPDTVGTYSGFSPGDLSNITITQLVQSPTENFFKPIDPGGGYFIHINSYDTLHPTPPGPPIPPPGQITGLAIVRGSTDGITPNDYVTLFWDESISSWKFAYNTAGDGTTVGVNLAVAVSNLNADNYVSIGTNAAVSGLIRMPTNSNIIVTKDSTNNFDVPYMNTDVNDNLNLGNSNYITSMDGTNIAMFSDSASATFGSGRGVVFMKNGLAPSTNPTGGGILYVESGALKFRGSGGTITVLGPA